MCIFGKTDLRRSHLESTINFDEQDKKSMTLSHKTFLDHLNLVVALCSDEILGSNGR